MRWVSDHSIVARAVSVDFLEYSFRNSTLAPTLAAGVASDAAAAGGCGVVG
jgi:hypothetical protein